MENDPLWCFLTGKILFGTHYIRDLGGSKKRSTMVTKREIILRMEVKSPVAQILYWLNYHVFRSLHFKFPANFIYRSLRQQVFTFEIVTQKDLLILVVVGDRIPPLNMATDGVRRTLRSFFVWKPKQYAIVNFLQVERLFRVTFPYQMFLQLI
jgi:hypothetical protein